MAGEEGGLRRGDLTGGVAKVRTVRRLDAIMANTALSIHKDIVGHPGVDSPTPGGTV